MRVSCKQAGFAAGLILLVAIPAAAQVGGYGGMGGFGGIASGAGFGESRPDVPSVRPWLNVTGSASRFHDGSGDRPTGYGASAAGGVSVAKAWARTTLVGSYRAGGFLLNPYRNRFSGNGTGLSQVVGVQAVHQVSQRLAVSVSVMGGSSNGGYGVGGGIGGFGGTYPMGTFATASPSQGQILSSNIDLGLEDMEDNGLVDNELFSTRVNYVGLNGGVSYTADQRNIFSFSGGTSRVRRALSYLVGLNSYGAGAGYTRVLTEKMSTGVHYRFGTFEYPGYYGGNQVHTVGWSLRYRFNSKTSLGVHAGGFLYRVNNIGTIVLAPELAAILGTPTIQQVNDYSFRSASGGVSLSRSLRVGRASAAYNRGANPGNGLLFPTLRETVTVRYSIGGSKFSAATSAHYSTGKSISQLSGSSSTKALIAAASYRLLGSMHVTGSVGEYWTAASTLRGPRSLSAHVGIAFSPGSYPLWF